MELAAFRATQLPGLRSMGSFSSRAAVGGLMPILASWRGSRAVRTGSRRVPRVARVN